MNVTVYCSSQLGLPQICEDVASQVGKIIGSTGCNLVYGGVDAGLMHTVANEAKLNGSLIVGIVPATFKHRTDTLVDEAVFTNDLNDRKGELISRGDLFVVLPGGIGTLDEWISTLSALKIAPEDKRKIVVANMDGIFDFTIDQLNQIAASPFTPNKEYLNANIIANNPDELSAMLTKAIEEYEKK